MANQPVLNLDRLADRPVVIIGGEEYRLYTTDLLPPLDHYRVRKLIKRIDEITLQADGSPRFDLTEAEEDELAGREVTEPAADGAPSGRKSRTPRAAVRMVRRGGLLDQAVRIVLDAPDAIHTRLDDRQRVEVLATFHMPSWLLRDAVPAATPAASETAIPTGETSPADSVASTQG